MLSDVDHGEYSVVCISSGVFSRLATGSKSCVKRGMVRGVISSTFEKVGGSGEELILLGGIPVILGCNL